VAALTEHQAALAIRADQRSHWWGLPPAVETARLLAARGERLQAVDVLTAALAPFPDDLHRPCVKRARQLLTELS
jgi:hypothetical protein